MRKIKKIIIHCSGSDKDIQDNIKAVKQLHTDPKEITHFWGDYVTNGRAWSDVGYHYYICKNGLIEKGRPLSRQGAHCSGQNEDSVGICLGGNKHFTETQLSSARELLFFLCKNLQLGNAQIFGHNHFNKNKTCPNINIKDILPL